MLNRTVLTGRLTKDVNLRYTQSGIAVGSFILAVNRSFTNQQGEREADFVNCIIWRKSAENFANFVHKGSLVGIDGRIQTRNYENQQGQRVYITEVVVDNFSLLESRNSGQNGDSQTSSNTTSGNLPGNHTNGSAGGSTNSGSDPFANNSDSIDISDDDLPF